VKKTTACATIGTLFPMEEKKDKSLKNKKVNGTSKHCGGYQNMYCRNQIVF
jgi:hypothetical protein